MNYKNMALVVSVLLVFCCFQTKTDNEAIVKRKKVVKGCEVAVAAFREALDKARHRKMIEQIEEGALCPICNSLQDDEDTAGVPGFKGCGYCCLLRS